MEKRKHPAKYPLDNSGIIHLAALKKGHSNSFRIAVTLREPIKPLLLQQALDMVTPRFPTMVAGIRNGFFRHYVISVESAPNIRMDGAPLSYMTSKQIKECAMRVLYRDSLIAVEFFHSLTDGYGGFQFVKALLAEYLRLTHCVDCSNCNEVITPDSQIEDREIEDSYAVYAGGPRKALHTVQSCQLPGGYNHDNIVHTTTAVFPVEELLQTAHRYHVSLTTFLTAVMAAAVMEVQTQHQSTEAKLKPVQIMVPVNLRKLFPSQTLRNFSLYALPCICPEDGELSLEAIINKIDCQMKEQIAHEPLQAMMTTNVELARNRFFRLLPLRIKCFGLRIGHFLFGERNSSLSLSNLGELCFPEAMHPYIQRVEFLLSPRIRSPYNCGIVSYDKQLYINFSRTCSEPELERSFFRKLSELGHIPALRLDGTPVGFEQFLYKNKKTLSTFNVQLGSKAANI